jgi:hypothetical protein
VSDAHEDIQSAPNPFLAEILGFRPEAIKELAEKEGIDLEALNLLKRHKISAPSVLNSNATWSSSISRRTCSLSSADCSRHRAR